MALLEVDKVSWQYRTCPNNVIVTWHVSLHVPEAIEIFCWGYPVVEKESGDAQSGTI